MIALNKLPPPQQLKDSIKVLDEKMMTQEQIGVLLRIWPSPDDINTLIEENQSKSEEEKWDKGEEYFLQIIDQKNIKQKLQVWQVKLDWPERKEGMLQVLKTFEHAFDEVRHCEILKKILSILLSLGNIMNGGTNKGRADGFYLEALSKTTTMKDNSNNTILAFICKKLKEEDEEIVNFKQEVKNVYTISQH